MRREEAVITAILGGPCTPAQGHGLCVAGVFRDIIWPLEKVEAGCQVFTAK